MCKSKYQVLYSYLLAAFFALIAVANHFNFDGRATADAILAEAHPYSTISETDSLTSSTPVIADNFAVEPVPVTAKTTPVSSVAVKLPAATRVKTTSVDAASGIKIYHNMLYAHSTLAGHAFKKLSVGTRFEATIDGVTKTYKVVSRSVYSRDYLNSHDSLRASIYDYDGLSLMTCGNGRNNDESYRLVIFAIPD